ncbi:MAG: hypothetical protein V1899_01230 [Planctomycetota bacterium]
MHRAYTTMTEIRSALYRRLVEYILLNENRLRDESNNEDSYSFSLQQIDELFLNKMSILERTISELSRCEHHDGQATTTTYEAVEVLAKREDLPQKIADALAEHGESDFLDMCVLRADDKQAEVLLVLVREDSGVPTAIAHPERQQRKKGEHGEDQPGGSNETDLSF